MYWPIGAPRVSAATKHRLPEEHVNASDEDEATRSPPLSVTVLANGDSSSERSDELASPALGAKGENASPNRGASAVDEQRQPSIGFRGNSLTEKGPERDISGEIVGLRVTRNGQMFATITRSTLTIWQTKPTAILASVLRSEHSLKAYGTNEAVLLRPDSAIFVIQTAFGYLITYSLASDPSTHVYRHQHVDHGSGHSRRQSMAGHHRAYGGMDALGGAGEGAGIREVSVRFRMVIRVDAGIAHALALDDELIVATERPAAVQCIRWTPDSTGSQTSTELLSRMPWIAKRSTIVDFVHDRPMNLSTWITNDGKAYAVQRLLPEASEDAKAPKTLFRGYGFHVPESNDDRAVKSSINARFSLIAVGCANGDVHVYTARDYVGRIPLSHRLRPNVSSGSTGRLTFLSYSPDGHCLFAGYEKGWMTWSVFGKPGAASFTSDRSVSHAHDDGWLLGVKDGFWVGGGSEILLLGHNDNRLWTMEMARSAVSGCFAFSNVSRSLLQTSTGFILYRGYDVPDLTTISAEVTLWRHVQIPPRYLMEQWPIRSAVISPDGRYVAVAGRRGLAHYSVISGRWKIFEDRGDEEEFTVRGGMCWHHHVLVAAVESNGAHELRVYSRESALDRNRVMHVEQLPAPIVLVTTSGTDSLLAYSYENILYHFIIMATKSSIKLVQVGQIALNGIIRAPPRVRAVSWLLPEDQMRHGDPSQDVAVATVLFLVDGKLVLLQPATSEEGELKYEMRIIAQDVEYYILMRDQLTSMNGDRDEATLRFYDDVAGDSSPTMNGPDLKDSLWYFDGRDMNVWTDVQDVLQSASADLGRDIPETVRISVDFYPLSALLNKGVLFGVESELIQWRDVTFAYFRFTTRTHLFLPALFRHHLSQYNSPAALHLSHHYQTLAYFSHALEILLHDVLDEEADSPPPSDQALLPSVLSFLSSFPQYLDIVVQCTRKTELRSWRTLFAYLPPPQDLFEESLQRGSLKTAGGYLLVLHTFEELGSSSDQLLRLLGRAKEEADWDLCKDLARFLAALDGSGATLRDALESVGLAAAPAGRGKRGSSPLGKSAPSGSESHCNGSSAAHGPDATASSATSSRSETAWDDAASVSR